MLSKRIIVCLDVRDGQTTKGVRFRDNRDIGDPVEMARSYYEQGVDELVFYDITASAERRRIFLDVVERVARVIFVPFAVGGGISSVEQMREVLLAGAEKVSVNSQAVRNPKLIAGGAEQFGSQCVVLGLEDQYGLVQSKAFVALHEGFKPSEQLSDELKAFCKQKLAPYKYPRVIEFLPELPKTGPGKIDKRQLRERGL